MTTYLDLVGEERLPEDVVRDVKRYRTRSGSVKLNVALSDLPEFPSWDQDGERAQGPGRRLALDRVPRARVGRREVRADVRAPLHRGRVPDGARARGARAEGKHLMLGFAQYGPYELRDGSWDDRQREACAARARAIGEYAPKLEGSVEHVEVLAPRDIEERFGLIGGNIMQGELTPDQMFSFRPIPTTATTGRRSPGCTCAGPARIRAAA